MFCVCLCFYLYTFEHILIFLIFYIDSPPNKSLGRNELRLDGVLLGSLQSREVDHRVEDGLFVQPVFHGSVEACLPEPLQFPDDPFC